MEIRPILSALLRSKTGAILVAVQVALSLAILTNALHIVQVRQAVAARSSGVANEADVFGIYIRHLKAATHEEQLANQKHEEAVLRAVPGVMSVSGTNQMPLSRSRNYNGVASDRKQEKTTTTEAAYETSGSLVRPWACNWR